MGLTTSTCTAFFFTIKAVFSEHSWLSCCGHNINLIVSHALDPKHVDAESPFRPVVDLVATAKDIVTRVKRTQTQHRLETTLKQVVSTRWNSTLMMLKSIADNLESLRTAAAQTNDRTMQKSLLDVNEELLCAIISVLELFDTATRLVSADKSPTLHLVVPVHLQLVKGIQLCGDDVEPVRQLKLRLQQFLDTHFKLHELHCMAVLFDPRLKNNLSVMSTDARDQATNSIKQMESAVSLPDSGGLSDLNFSFPAKSAYHLTMSNFY